MIDYIVVTNDEQSNELLREKFIYELWHITIWTEKAKLDWVMEFTIHADSLQVNCVATWNPEHELILSCPSRGIRKSIITQREDVAKQFGNNFLDHVVDPLFVALAHLENSQVVSDD